MLNIDAYDEGAEAWRNAEDINSNPYFVDTAEFDEWERGWQTEDENQGMDSEEQEEGLGGGLPPGTVHEQDVKADNELGED